MMAGPYNPLDEEKIFLNVAATVQKTSCLGPGLRSVVWVQGCPFHCPGCVAPEWIPIQPGRLVLPEELVDELLADPAVEGLTFSGGEPMIQAMGLASLSRRARQRRDLTIICFTGFIFENLVKNPPVPGVEELLAQVDVLIDGPYISRLNDNKGLRGSSNQRIIQLTDRLEGIDLFNSTRKAEVQVHDGQVMMIGVPPNGMEQAFLMALDRAGQLKWELLQYERL